MYKKLANLITSGIRSGLFLMAILATPVMGQVPINPESKVTAVTQRITCDFDLTKPAFTFTLGAGEYRSFEINFDQKERVLFIKRRELLIMETSPMQKRERVLAMQTRYNKDTNSFVTTAKVVETWFQEGEAPLIRVKDVRLHPMAEHFMLTTLNRTFWELRLRGTPWVDEILAGDIRILMSASLEDFLAPEAEGDGLENNKQ